MNKIINDKFISNLLRIRCYHYINNLKNINLNSIKKLKRPFFLTLKTKYPLKKKYIKEIPAKFICKQILLRKRLKEKNFNLKNCYIEKNQFKKNVLKISLEKTSNSHFSQDKDLPVDFRKRLRFNWVKNFYKGQRGDFLIVYKKKIVSGFLLLLKKKENLIIDLIVTKKSQAKKGVGRSLVKFVCSNFFHKKTKFLLAGTQSNNKAALKFYKKIGFKKTNINYFIYHIFLK